MGVIQLCQGQASSCSHIATSVAQTVMSYPAACTQSSAVKPGTRSKPQGISNSFWLTRSDAV